jgi:anthraniloyl-CoA monooxygenase
LTRPSISSIKYLGVGRRSLDVKIACIGGGPAGLYFAISAKLRDPTHDVVVYERNRPGDTFGWGVVLSDQVLETLAANDAVTADAIHADFAYWDDIDVIRGGRSIRSGGHGFCGIGRKRLLNILQERAAGLGVEQLFETDVDDVEALAGSVDLVVAADGANSRVRERYADHFRPDVDLRPNRFIWLGSDRKLDAFSFVFEDTDHGPVWIHAYQFEPETSTVIVECGPETWAGLGFAELDTDETIAWCEEKFSGFLQGARLRSNAAHLRGSAVWLQFPRISCERWYRDNVVLMGDAAHTAHFSIGSGSRLAMEDAIDLADRLGTGTLPEVLAEYEAARKLEVMRLQSAARNSMEWFENFSRYEQLEPEQFAYALLTRSQRVSHENLRLRDESYLAGLEEWFTRRTTGDTAAGSRPPMFTPFRLRDLELANRIVVSPMSMYSAVDGVPADFHLVHYGARAHGGAGLVITEMTDVLPDGRITPGCAGIWNDEQTTAWRRIVDYVHEHTPAKIALQLGHAGPKGATKLEWEGANEPLEEGGWPLLAASAVPWSSANQVPKAMTRTDMDVVTEAYRRSAERAAAAGFDMVELHFAHGYLLSSFITPLTNRRTDEYGGSLENRLRYPLEIFNAVRGAFPGERPISVRISATDWVEVDGVIGNDAVAIADAFAAAGADILDISAGQTSTEARPIYGRMFQTPLSDQVRNETGVATMAVGNITEPDHVNSIIMAGRADLCCLARPHLADPNWTLRAAAELDYDGISWPIQYVAGGEQLRRLARRAAEMAVRV